MSHIRIDKQKALKKWSPVLENMGVSNEERLDWMSEYAEYHSINENAYVNAGIAGMGTITAPQASTLAGTTLGTNYTGFGGAQGSGDLGQNLLPVAMKIAAQTIGLDLVAVKPTPGPKIDLLYIDFQYDDVNLEENERPQVFKLATNNTLSSATMSALNTKLTQYLATAGITENVGGLKGGRLYVSINTTGGAGLTAAGLSATASTTLLGPLGAVTSKQGIVEFLGFSRIDGFPMFRAFKQYNAVGTYNGTVAPYQWDQSKNTFNATTAMSAQISAIATITLVSPGIELVSALEDHIPGFVSNWTSASNSASGTYPMSRNDDDNTYAGVIGPKVSSKSIAVGTIEVSSALRRSEIEDIKANTGMDIVQKMESILVNELSQTISKQIVAKIFEMGDLNRQSAPLMASAGGVLSSTASTIFDLNTNYVVSGPGGETTHAVQRKLITKMVHASNYLATEGRVGPAQYVVTNGGIAAALMDVAGYTINPVKSKMNGAGQMYPVGQIGDITIYVDPYMKYNDNRMVLGRKNNPDQPGIIFVPYLMAQSISLISEATFAPRMLLRSRYAVSEVGWYPQKQYMTIVVNDSASYLN